MLLVTWNVNSLRARMPRVLELLDAHAPDVVCLQETKCAPAQFPHLELQAAGYTALDVSGGRWAGVAILVRDGLEAGEVTEGLPGAPAEVEEARWVEATVAGIRVVSVYVVNGRSLDDDMFAVKLGMLEAMRDRAETLQGGPLVIAGDLNVAPTDTDVWDPAHFRGRTHVSREERERLRAILATGLRDAWEAAPARAEHTFTWWDYRAGSFHRDRGMRIDLALVSPDLVDGLTWVGIDREFRKGPRPSDHAPLLVRLADGVLPAA